MYLLRVYPIVGTGSVGPVGLVAATAAGDLGSLRPHRWQGWQFAPPPRRGPAPCGCRRTALASIMTLLLAGARGACHPGSSPLLLVSAGTRATSHSHEHHSTALATSADIPKGSRIDVKAAASDLPWSKTGPDLIPYRFVWLSYRDENGTVVEFRDPYRQSLRCAACVITLIESTIGPIYLTLELNGIGSHLSGPVYR